MYLDNVKKKIKFLTKIKILLKKNNYKLILFNRTLLCAETINLLSHDNYDDVILDQKILKDKNLLAKIKSLFNCRIHKNKIKIFYDQFELNIYLVNFNLEYYIFKGFILNLSYLKKTKQKKILSSFFLIPKFPEKIFNKIFFPIYKDIILAALRDNREKKISRFKNFSLCLIYMLFFYKRYPRYVLNQKIYELYQLSIFKFISSAFRRFKKKEIFKVDIKQFKKLKFDPIEYNCYFREHHYSYITRNLKNFKIKDIINFLKEKKIINIKKGIRETIIIKQLKEPIYLNKKFWRSGNNFYINPILYGFKKNFIGYEKVNNYLDLQKKPRIYTGSYYQKLKDMSENEIKNLLKQNPIEINKYGFLSGRHRVAAMIGRLLRGEKYFPFYVYKT